MSASKTRMNIWAPFADFALNLCFVLLTALFQVAQSAPSDEAKTDVDLPRMKSERGAGVTADPELEPILEVHPDGSVVDEMGHVIGNATALSTLAPALAAWIGSRRDHAIRVAPDAASTTASLLGLLSLLDELGIRSRVLARINSMEAP